MQSALAVSKAPHARRLHPLPVRFMHWTNAVAMFIMIGSGWKIYEDEAIFGWLHFPDAITFGPYAQHGLQLHFFGMWILGLNGLAYVTYGLVTGRFRRMHASFVRVPALVIHGAVDQMASPEGAEELARLIPGAELLVVPEVGHAVNLEGQRAVNPALRSPRPPRAGTCRPKPSAAPRSGAPATSAARATT